MRPRSKSWRSASSVTDNLFMSKSAANSYDSPPRSLPIREDLAYILPMAAFLALIGVGVLGTETGHGNTWYPWAYLAPAIIVAAMLIAFRRASTKIL